MRLFSKNFDGNEQNKRKSLYSNETPSYSIVKNWYNEFTCGQRSLPERRPKMFVIPETIDAVR